MNSAGTFVDRRNGAPHYSEHSRLPWALSPWGLPWDTTRCNSDRGRNWRLLQCQRTPGFLMPECTFHNKSFSRCYYYASHVVPTFPSLKLYLYVFNYPKKHCSYLLITTMQWKSGVFKIFIKHLFFNAALVIYYSGIISCDWKE